ncbi:hypothetical protein Tco_0300009 [Tanacetum coccineum]
MGVRCSAIAGQTIEARIQVPLNWSPYTFPMTPSDQTPPLSSPTQPCSFPCPFKSLTRSSLPSPGLLPFHTYYQLSFNTPVPPPVITAVVGRQQLLQHPVLILGGISLYRGMNKAYIGRQEDSA